MKITWEPIWYWPVTTAVIVGIVLLVLFTYPNRLRQLPRKDRRLLIGLRLFAVFLLAVAMFRPVLHRKSEDKQTYYLYFLLDDSHSMTTPDGPGGTPRRRELMKTLVEAEKTIESFGKQVVIRFFDFAEKLEKIEIPKEKSEGLETNIAFALREMLKETSGKRVLGFIMMSDGAPRVANNLNQRDLAREAASDCADRNVPIHTVAYGGSGLSDTSIDVAVEDFQFDPNPFEGKVVETTASLRIRAPQGLPLSVRILIEDRTGIGPGQTGKMIEALPLKHSVPRKTIPIPGSNRVVPMTLSFTPPRAGEYKIAIEAIPLNGEILTTNNRIEKLISVRGGGISVAYFDRIRTEQKYLRRINASENIQVDFLPVRWYRNGPQTKIDPSLFDPGPGAYDVYIIGDVPAAVFGAELLKKLRKRIDEGAGLLMLGGYDSFGPGGYAGTPLADALPVEMSKSERRIGNEILPSLQYLQPLQMIPTERGLRHFVMRIDAKNEHKKRWLSLAKIEGANRLKKKEGGLVEVLAETPDGSPLLLSTMFGSSRVMAFAADTTFQWYLNGDRDAHQRFWRQMMLYLAKREEESEKSVWVKIPDRDFITFSPKRPVTIRFGTKGDNGKPIPDTQFDVELTDPLGKKHNAIPARDGDDFRIVFQETNATGDYWVKATAKSGGNVIGTAWSRFRIEPKDLEMDNSAADPELLKEISALSGGTNLQPEQLPEFLQRIRDRQMDRNELPGFDRVTLWDTWPRFGKDNDSYIPLLLILFVSVMTLEWFLRKRKGLV